MTSPLDIEAKIAAYLTEHPTCETCGARSRRVSIVDGFNEAGEATVRLGAFCLDHGRGDDK